MSKKVNVIFEGSINDYDAVKSFQDLLISLGSKVLQVVDTLDIADMKVDISHLSGVSDLFKEAIYTINTAKAIQGYERKRKRVFKTIKNKILIASSNKSITP